MRKLRAHAHLRGEVCEVLQRLGGERQTACGARRRHLLAQLEETRRQNGRTQEAQEDERAGEDAAQRRRR